MPGPLKEVPLDRIEQLWFYIPLLGRRGPCNAKNRREEVAEWAKNKRSRMTPWGVQYYGSSPRSGIASDQECWLPPIPFGDEQRICGRWIRDFEIPSYLAGHPENCQCYGQTEMRMVKILDTDHYGRGDVLTAYQHGEVADPTIDMAERPSRLSVPQTECDMLTELPAEILDLILDYLVPPGGHTYHFFPGRSGQNVLQVVQKLVAEDPAHPAILAPRQCKTATGKPFSPAIQTSVHMSLAATNRAYQHLLYERFYSQSSFIFHLTSYAIQPSISSSSFDEVQSWSRTYNVNPEGILGPVTARAASYMRNVTLLASLPHSHTSKDVSSVEGKIQNAVTALQDVELDTLAVHLAIAPANLDPRYSVTALPVEILDAKVENGSVKVTLVKPNTSDSKKKTVIRESNRAQQVLRPLLSASLQRLKHCEVSGAISKGFKTKLEEAALSTTHTQATPAKHTRREINMDLDEESRQQRPTKKRRMCI